MHIRFLLLCYLLITQSVVAGEVDGLFHTEVTVHSQSREDRNKALREALLMVMSRLTPAKKFAQNPVLTAALDNAAAYVDQYQYVLNSAETGKNSLYMLRVTFNKDTLMVLMRSSGLAVWDATRDKILLWLVIEQRGKRAFLDIDRDLEVEEALQDSAMANGLPLLLPLMDLEEKQAISVNDILASSPDKIMTVSARYGVAAVLSGKLIKRRSCWRSEWALSFNDKSEQWQVPCAGLKTNLTNALQRVYQRLSIFYAVKAEQ